MKKQGEEEIMSQLSIMSDLVSMPEQNFKECVEYVKNAEFSERVKEFLELLINKAAEARACS